MNNKQLLILAIIFIFLQGGIFGQKESGKTTSETKIRNQAESKAMQKKFTRPEERGEDFTKKTSGELIEVMRSSGDKIELRKAAKTLGDRDINKTLLLSAEEKQIIDKSVVKYLELIKFRDPNVYDEACQQIHRLWHLAVPALLRGLDSGDLSVVEFAAKSLILMRNEEIINEIINKAETSADTQKKELLLFFLTQMKEQRTSVVPARTCLNESDSEKLYERLVQPALNKMKVK